jgi:hypothetical protein
MDGPSLAAATRWRFSGSRPRSRSCALLVRLSQAPGSRTGPGPAGRERQRRCDAVGQACRQYARTRRVRVEAFGLNRSELQLRLGLSAGLSFPRVPGIEAAGTVDADTS